MYGTIHSQRTFQGHGAGGERIRPNTFTTIDTTWRILTQPVLQPVYGTDLVPDRLGQHCLH